MMDESRLDFHFLHGGEKTLVHHTERIDIRCRDARTSGAFVRRVGEEVERPFCAPHVSLCGLQPKVHQLGIPLVVEEDVVRG